MEKVTVNPPKKGCYRAIETTDHPLTAKLGVNPDQIILIGQSVGSGPTCWLAAHKQHHSVVLVSPFLSAFRTVTHVPISLRDRFPNHKWIKEFDPPSSSSTGKKTKLFPSNMAKVFTNSLPRKKTSGSPLRPGPRAASRPSRQKQIPRSQSSVELRVQDRNSVRSCLPASP